MAKKHLALTTAMAATLSSLSACSSNDDWSDGDVADRDTAVCVDQAGRRTDDNRCGDRGGVRGGSHGWFYVNRGSRLPYYGDSVADPKLGIRGSALPQAGTEYGRAPARTNMTRSTAVARGGFGSSSRSFGGSRS